MPQMMQRRGSISTKEAAAAASTATAIKWRGANVVIKPTHTSWKDFWGANYDLSWITTQIDRAKTLGCNAIRIIGAVNGIVSGDYTRATYLARVQAVHDYVTSLNMWSYFVGAGDYSTTLNNATRDELVALVTMLVGQPNVVGIDILQEYNIFASANGLTFAADMATPFASWSAAILAANPTISRTYSVGISYSYGTVETEISAITDHYDFHTYSTTPASSAWGAANKRWIIGEFGAAQDLTADQRATQYTLVAATNAGYSLSNGAFCWALADQDVVASNMYGVFDNNGVERTEMTDVLRARFPKTR